MVVFLFTLPNNPHGDTQGEVWMKFKRINFDTYFQGEWPKSMTSNKQKVSLHSAFGVPARYPISNLWDSDNAHQNFVGPS